MNFSQILLEFETQKEKKEAIDRYTQKFNELKKKYNSLKNLKGNSKNVEKVGREMDRYLSMIDYAEKVSPKNFEIK